MEVAEACGLVLSQVDIASKVLHVQRLKDRLSTTHPLRGDEIRAIKAWLADRARMKPDTEAFFISERRQPLSRKTAWLMVRDYGRRANLPVEAHPHMLRHACGYALADQGADTRLIQDMGSKDSALRLCSRRFPPSAPHTGQAAFTASGVPTNHIYHPLQVP